MCATCGCNDVNDVAIQGNQTFGSKPVQGQKVMHKPDMEFQLKAVPMEKAKNSK